jgi:hypothetical protein
VVAAPVDSEPTTPLEDTRTDFVHSLELDDIVDSGLESNMGDAQEHDGRPGLPPRSNQGKPDREVSGLPDEATAVSSWQAAQDEESQSRNIWADTDNGHS